MPDIVPDMEDLLKRASEDYPLKEGPDKWEDIASRLSVDSPLPKSPNTSGRKRYYALALLLLLFLCIGFYFVNTGINYTGKGDQKNITGEKIPEVQKQEVLVKQKTIAPARKTTAGLPENNRQAAGEKVNTTVYQHQHQRPAGMHYPERKATVQTGHKQMAYFSAKSRKQKSGYSGNSAGKPLEQMQLPLEQKQFLNSGTRLTGPVDKTDGTAHGFNLHRYTDKLMPYERLSFKQENKQKSTASPRRFYYGIMAGKGFSMVKSFGLQKNCFDYGLLAGYRLNGRLSLETGLLAVKKYYTSKGKDFSMEEMGAMMPAGMKLMEVEGSSRVVELPLHLRLDILTGRNKRFFSAAGFSSFIMTKEYNTYHTMMNGVSEKLYGTYYKDRRYVAAAFNLVAGYEQQLTRSIALRLEPYVQIPVRGVGVGKLPVTSTGLRIGITRSAR